jgi:hypothetical protein
MPFIRPGFRHRSTRAILLLALLGAASGASHAFDTFSAEYAHGNQTKSIRLGAQADWGVQWLRSQGAHVRGYWDVSLAQWHGSRFRDQPGRSQDVTLVGITPVLRWQANNGTGLYLEAGVGAHLLSDEYDNNRRQLSGHLQFGSHLGAGYLFGNGLDLGLNFRHFSNASIREPNDGVNFLGFRVAYAF